MSRTTSVAILGLGRFGSQLAEELVQSGVEVLAVDRDGELVNELAQTVFLAAEGDLTDWEFLESLDLGSYSTVVVAIGSEVATSVLLTLVLKQRHHLPHVVAKASTRDHSIALGLAGADRVVSPEQESAIRLAHTLGTRHVGEYLSLGRSYGIAKVQAPAPSHGRKAGDVDFLRQYRVFLLARVRGESVSFNPDLDEVVHPGDTWVIAGRDQELNAIEF